MNQGGNHANYSVGNSLNTNRRSSIVIEDRIMQNLEKYARKVESVIFETATSKVSSLVRFYY